MGVFVQSESHAWGGLACFALVQRLELWSSTSGLGWDGMQGDKRTARRPASLAGG